MVGCWITSRSGWLLELLTELISNKKARKKERLTTIIIISLDMINLFCRTRKPRRKRTLLKRPMRNLYSTKTNRVILMNLSIRVGDDNSNYCDESEGADDDEIKMFQVHQYQ